MEAFGGARKRRRAVVAMAGCEARASCPRFDALCVAVRCNPAAPQPVPFLRGLLHAHRELRQAAKGAAVVQSPNPLFNDILCRSMSDLAMLKTETPQGPYPYAGLGTLAQFRRFVERHAPGASMKTSRC